MATIPELPAASAIAGTELTVETQTGLTSSKDASSVAALASGVFSTAGLGMVPAPAAGDGALRKILRADGTWVSI